MALGTPSKGFTLVEVMIALGIMAVIGVITASLMNTAVSNSNAVAEKSRALEDVAFALATWRRDLEQITRRKGRDEFGDELNSALYGTGGSGGVVAEFIKTGRRQLPGQFVGSNIERVSYRFLDGVLYRFSAPVSDPDRATVWRQQLIIDGIDSLELAYYDGSRWLSQWPPAGNVSAGLPAAVSLRLETARWQDIRLDVLLPGPAR